MTKIDDFDNGSGEAPAKDNPSLRTKEEFAAAIDAFAAEHGRLPDSAELAAVFGLGIGTVYRYCRRYGVSLSRKPHRVRFTKEAFVAAADAFAAEHGGPPTCVELAAVLGISDRAVNRYRYKYGVKLTRLSKTVRFTKEAFTAAIDAFAAEHGRLPDSAELAAVFGVSKRTTECYCREYGISLRSMRAASVNVPHTSRRLTKEELVGSVDAFAAEHGRLPFNHELAAVLGIPDKAVKRYRYKYGVKLPKRTVPRKPQVHCSKEEFFGKLEAFRARHGRLPVDAELAAVMGVTRSTIINYKKRYGVSLPRKPHPVRLTKEAFVASRDAFAAEHGRLPDTAELAAVLGLSDRAADRYRYKYGVELFRKPSPRLLTKEEFTAAADAFAASRGRLPDSVEFAAALGVSLITVSRCCREYGVSLPRKPSLFLTKETVAAAVDAFAAEHGRPPLREELAAVLGVSEYKTALYLSKYGISIPRRPSLVLSKKEVVAAADALTAEHGRPPSRKELAAALGVSMTTVIRCCREYGVSISVRKAAVCTKEELAAKADALAAEHGRPPSCKELAAVLGLTSPAVYRYCREYGVKLTRISRPVRLTKEEFVAAADAFAAEHGRPPTFVELAAALGIPDKAADRYRYKYGVKLARMPTPVRRTKEAFVAAADAFAAEHGRLPDSRELAAALGLGIGTVYLYCKMFGVSFRHKPRPVRLTKEELAAKADAFAAEHGRLPDSRELAAVLGLSLTTVYRFCREYGVSLRHKPRPVRLTKEEFVAAADAFAAEHGRLPDCRELAAALGIPDKAAARYRYKYGVKLTRAPTPVRRTKEAFVGSVDAFAAEHGRLPDCRELAAALGLGIPAVYRYCKRFGVSLRRKRTRVRCTKEAFVAAADAFAAEHGRLPDCRELAAALGLGSPAVYRYRKIYGVSILRRRTSVRSTGNRTSVRWTKESFVGKVDALAAEHGRPPTREEIAAVLGLSIPSADRYCRKYGVSIRRMRKDSDRLRIKEEFAAALDAFVASCGRLPDSDELAAALGVCRSTVNVYCRRYGVRLLVRPAAFRYSKEAFTAKTAAFAAEHGRPPYLNELAALLDVNRHTVRAYCRNYGVTLPRKPMDYGLPRERIVAAADAFAAEHGRQPYSHELAAALGINRTTANRYRIRFGLKFSRPPRPTGRNLFSKEELVAAIDAFRAEHGRLPTAPELARALGVSPPTVHVYLGLHGLKLLRRPPPTGRYRFTKEELVAAIDAFRAERGRLPTASELGRALGVASATAHRYLDRHGLKLPVMPPPKPRGRNLFTKEELLAAIDAFLAERGRLPTTPELGRALGVASITAHVYLDIHGLKLPQRPSMRYTHLTISN